MLTQFFYDEQIRRFLLQFARIFSNFAVEYGRDEEGTSHTLVRVPVRYGDSSRQAQTVLQNNSASFLNSCPLMTFYVTGLNYELSRIQNPTYVSTINVRQRTYDQMTDSYETTQGNAFTIDRLMPVPYKLTINLDIWTSNTNQKMQLLEQILVLFNPALEIQDTDNYIDWTSLTICELKNVNWSNKTIPVGSTDQVEISTLTFDVPIWLTSPAKVKKLGVVERIIAGIFDAQGNASDAVMDNDLLLGTRQIFTPYGYQVLAIGNDPYNLKLQVLAQNAVVDQPNESLVPPDSPPSNLLWTSILGLYGTLRPGISLIALEQDDGTEVYGTIAIDPTDDRFLLYSIDSATVPANTLQAIDAIINPLLSGPDNGLIPAAEGQRYLLTEATGSFDNSAPANPAAWLGDNGQPLVANANDIIEFTGGRWVVSFDSSSSPANLQYVTNITTSIQYQWTGQMWVKSYQGLYPGGKWNIIL